MNALAEGQSFGEPAIAYEHVDASPRHRDRSLRVDNQAAPGLDLRLLLAPPTPAVRTSRSCWWSTRPGSGSPSGPRGCRGRAAARRHRARELGDDDMPHPGRRRRAAPGEGAGTALRRRAGGAWHPGHPAHGRQRRRLPRSGAVAQPAPRLLDRPASTARVAAVALRLVLRVGTGADRRRRGRPRRPRPPRAATPARRLGRGAGLRGASQRSSARSAAPPTSSPTCCLARTANAT